MKEREKMGRGEEEERGEKRKKWGRKILTLLLHCILEPLVEKK